MVRSGREVPALEGATIGRPKVWKAPLTWDLDVADEVLEVDVLGSVITGRQDSQAVVLWMEHRVWRAECYLLQTSVG